MGEDDDDPAAVGGQSAREMLALSSAASDLRNLADRALAATDLSVTLVDGRAGDWPLVWVNPAFSRVTGYQFAEVEGRNCRLLQGPDTDPEAAREMRLALEGQRSATVTLLNYRKDGSTFWNQVSLSPILADDGSMIGYVGVQEDVSERVETERQRERARNDAEGARNQLALLAEMTTQMAATLDVDATMDRLARLVVPMFADWVAIRLTGLDGATDKVTVHHRAGRPAAAARFAELISSGFTDTTLAGRVAQRGESILFDAPGANWRAHIVSPDLAEAVGVLGVGSVMVVPLVAAGAQILGTVAFVAQPGGRVFTDGDLSLATDIGRRAAAAIANARRYEHEHRIAETLQRSLLPDLPLIPGLTVAARYLANEADVEVGGDFYDLVALPDGTVGVAIGDIVGHDLAAAAAMGHLRGLLRAAAWGAAEDGRGDPAEIVDRVDRLGQALEGAPLATLMYGRLERLPDRPGWWRLWYANAGHPAPLLRFPDGSVRSVDEAQGLLLGVSVTGGRRAATMDIPPGSTLVCFTDGLFERRADQLDAGYELIAASLQSESVSLDAVIDRLLAACGSQLEDDTAILAIAFGAAS